MYQLITNAQAITQNIVVRLSDNTYIPFDPANTDYQKYLQWLSEGNEPLPPDEVIE